MPPQTQHAPFTLRRAWLRLIQPSPCSRQRRPHLTKASGLPCLPCPPVHLEKLTRSTWASGGRARGPNSFQATVVSKLHICRPTKRGLMPRALAGTQGPDPAAQSQGGGCRGQWRGDPPSAPPAERGEASISSPPPTTAVQVQPVPTWRLPTPRGLVFLRKCCSLRGRDPAQTTPCLCSWGPGSAPLRTGFRGSLATSTSGQTTPGR